ncbi:MAG: MFS transporter [Bacteroidota bacterium]
MTRNLLPAERKTFTLHMLYSFLEGIIAGIIILNEFVFVKSLLGSNYQLGVLFQFSVSVFLLLVFINEWIKRTRNKRKLLRVTAILTRAPFVLLFFFPRSADQLGGDSIYHYIFLVIFLIYFLGNTIIMPSINLFLKTSYRHENFGKLYSYATTVNKIVMMITTFVYGWMLDKDHYVFVYVFPVVAVLGIAAVFLLAAMPAKIHSQPAKKHSGMWNSVKDSTMGMVNILRNNRAFLDYEIGFMLYGFGFMSSVTVIVLFFEYGLGLNYNSIAFYKNAYNILAIFLLPFFGKLMGKIDPRHFSIIPFSAMFLFLFFIMITEYFPVHFEFWKITLYHTLLLYIIFHGIFAASMALAWFIGSAYFCPPEEAGNYQSVHLVLTGFRALFAPLLGIVFYEQWGFTTAFLISMGCLFLAIIYMFISSQTVKVPYSPGVDGSTEVKDKSKNG